MKKREFIKIGTIIFLLSLSAQVFSQKDFSLKSQISSYVGYESNPFKSPDTLYSVVNNQSFSKNELMKPDYFIEYNYDLSVGKKFGKHFLIDAGSQWHNKNFFNENILNTHLFNVGVAPAYIVNKKITIGAGYEFEKRAMIDADILGEQTKYVLSYIQNQAQFFIKTKPFKNNITNFYYTFQDKKYSNTYSSYNPNTPPQIELNLDNIQHKIQVRTVQTLNKRTKFNIGLGLYDRSYKYLPSYDMLLVPNINVMRHYQDINISSGLNSKLSNEVEIHPYIRYERRMDKFNNYFSFNRYDAGFETLLKYKKLVFDVDLMAKLYNYDKFEAPIIGTQNYPPLKYQYYISDIRLAYKVAKGIDIDTGFWYEKRNSTANRPTWKYRRGYDDFNVKAGLVIYPDVLFGL